MKIICRGHNGLIEVPDQELLNTLKRGLNGLAFNCTICNEVVWISNIQKEIISERNGALSAPKSKSRQ